MLPLGHAALGYLLYSGASHAIRGDTPTEWSVILLGFGTQFPDLIDKPFSWTFQVLPTGRSLFHSVFIVGLVCAAVILLSRRYGHRDLGIAFATGYGSHLIGDALHPAVTGSVQGLEWLVWPLIPADAVEYQKGFVEFFTSLTVTPWLLLEVLLAGGALVLWYVDGFPGFKLLRTS